ncbi:MAG: hypothetical protein BYD32DRAFT_405557 [Podila humilis]|nr:MAG: hypothetical protein BYD32DRAFT_405557 [Podila humilis]
MINPMEIPLVVHRVGQMLPLWDYSRRSAPKDSFQPRDLLSSIKVCRLWSAVLTPLLWTVYDDAFMLCRSVTDYSFDDEEHVGSIPEEIFRARSRHIRYLSLWYSLRPGSMQSAQLREIRLSGQALYANTDIIFTNPQLSNLTVAFDVGPKFSDIQPALQTLSQLQILSVVNLKVTAASTLQQLSGLLNSNSDLQKLRFEYPYGISGLDCEPLSNLTELHFLGDWDGNVGMIHLLRLCPNLEVLEALGVDCPMDQIAKNIKECCKKLATIRMKDGELTENKFALLVQSTSRLVNIEATVTAFSTKTCDVLLGHTNWLESVSLTVFYNKQECLDNTNRLLASCSCFRSLEFEFGKRTYMSLPDIYSDLELVNCPTLERLSLTGFDHALSCSSNAVDTVHAQGLSAESVRLLSQGSGTSLLEVMRERGWSCEPVMKGYYTSDITLQTAVAQWMVFRGLLDLPRLYKVSVEDRGFVHEARMPRNMRA